MATERKGGDSLRKHPHFFKVFLPGLTSEKLEIPPGFRKHMESTLHTCSLMGPSGNIWTVALGRSQAGELFFTHGWKELAQDHAMETGEFIVFIYYGAARFRLLIFDTSACEKESAFRASPSQTTAAEEEEEEEVVVVNDEQKGTTEGSPDAIVAVATPDASTELASKPRRRWSCCMERGGEEDPHAAGCMLQMEAAAGRGGAPEGSLPRAGAPKKTYEGKPRARGMLVSQRRPVTKEEIERAHRAALDFTSDNPFQVMIMRKSGVYLGHSVPLPHTFAKCHLPKCPQKIILSDSAGKQWIVTYLPLHGTYIFSAGWRQFSLDNHLEQDDACVFELIRKDEIRVHIFRVVEEVTPLIRKILRN